jgi:hypothetical protein
VSAPSAYGPAGRRVVGRHGRGARGMLGGPVTDVPGAVIPSPLPAARALPAIGLRAG